MEYSKRTNFKAARHKAPHTIGLAKLDKLLLKLIPLSIFKLLSQALEMEFNPANPIIKLLLQDLALEEQANPDQAVMHFFKRGMYQTLSAPIAPPSQ